MGCLGDLRGDGVEGCGVVRVGGVTAGECDQDPNRSKRPGTECFGSGGDAATDLM